MALADRGQPKIADLELFAVGRALDLREPRVAAMAPWWVRSGSDAIDARATN